MAQMPNIELQIAIVDADKLLAQVREIQESARRGFIAAAIVWVVTTAIALAVVFLR